MKKTLLTAAVGLGITTAGLSQGYESQYPYDPYSPTPQAQQPAYPAYNSYGGGKSYSGGGTGGDYSGAVSYPMLGYNSLEGRLHFNDFNDDSKLDGDPGFGVDLKVALMKPLYLHFGLDRLTADGPKSQNLELTTLTGAGGAYIPLGSRFHLIGEVGLRYDYVGGDLETIDTNEFSLFGRAGLRFAATERLELAASVLFNSADNLNDRAFELSAYYMLLSWLDVAAGIDFGDEVNSYQAGARVRW